MSKFTKAFYAVRTGRQTGVFRNWDECEAQITGFPGARYKKFTNVADAERFVQGLLDTSSVVAGSLSRASAKSTETHTDIRISKKRGFTSTTEGRDETDIVYSDGACKGNGMRDPIAGIGVWWGPDDPRNIAERCPGDQTNNRAELIAIIRVLETTPYSKQPLTIKTDSQYSIKCFKEWLPTWRKNNFRTSSGDPVKNLSLIQYLSALLETRGRRGQRVFLEYVKGHSGEIGNENADAQANRGALLPSVPERDWNRLREALYAQLQQDFDANDESAILSNDGKGLIPPFSSPTKIRKIDAEFSSPIIISDDEASPIEVSSSTFESTKRSSAHLVRAEKSSLIIEESSSATLQRNSEPPHSHVPSSQKLPAAGSETESRFIIDLNGGQDSKRRRAPLVPPPTTPKRSNKPDRLGATPLTSPGRVNPEHLFSASKEDVNPNIFTDCVVSNDDLLQDLESDRN